MKKIIFILVLISLFGCTSKKVLTTSDTTYEQYMTYIVPKNQEMIIEKTILPIEIDNVQLRENSVNSKNLPEIEVIVLEKK